MGAVAEEYPGAENTFIGVMNDEAFSYERDGVMLVAALGFVYALSAYTETGDYRFADSIMKLPLG